MNGVIPEKLINYKLYVDGSMSETALTDVDLPDIQYMSETISGAGISGEIDSITLGHTSAITLGLNIRTFIDEDFRMLEPRAYTIELKAGLQSLDQTNGKILTRKLSVMAKGLPKGFTLGKASVGKATDSKREFNLTYLKVELDGKELLEIDKVNMIYKVNGTDHLADLRAALGM